MSPSAGGVQEAEKNAQELVAEEERAKRKAEKKKLKKKKQKDRKKREKLGQEQKNKENTDPSPPSGAAGAGPPSEGAEDEELCPEPSPCPGDSTVPSGEPGPEGTAVAEEELDLSCTFVCKAREKAGVRLPPPGSDRSPGPQNVVEPSRKVPEKGRGDPVGTPVSPQPPQARPPSPSTVAQSLALAGHGIEAAQMGQHAEAVWAFTVALELNPREHRSHPARDCFPLWVGNVTSHITEKVLRRAFGRFGEIRSVRLLPGRRCAFINFRGKAEAEEAFRTMQGATVEGSKLLLQLKHPAHATPAPIADSTPRSVEEPRAVPAESVGPSR
ncbi:tetratricopeptide repeat protein 31 [Geospiza fortis]|uniref:Tetratricopeptide repeat protein 31 n=1 Tax=Geospiza fortis TaxID=48883 RepID=A0A8N5HYC1_GEOFO|nr:tetratricopeptide repeat protein 31 [Geospiza fortis]